MPPTPVPDGLTLTQLLAEPARARDLPSETARNLLLQLAPLQEALRLRALASADGNGQLDGPAAEDRFLTPKETARLLGVSLHWLYRHAKRLPFARRLSRKCLRFSEAGLMRWQAAKKA